MRYRKLSPLGDMVFGGSQLAFYRDIPNVVAQAVMTRLRLHREEWFVDIADGTDYRVGVLGKYTESTRDMVVRERILGTPGVLSLLSYSSTFDGNTRLLTISTTIDTIYGQAAIQESV